MQTAKDKTNSLTQIPVLPKRIKRLKSHTPFRQLKVQTKTVMVNPNLNSGRYKDIPSIGISGEWLRQVGFECGRQVVIIPGQGQLTIKVL